MFIPSETKRLLNKEHHSLNTPFDTALFDHNDDIINVQQGMEIITEMVHSEIVKSYTALNSKNLDFATPFLDDDLIHFMGSMPTSITNKNSIDKYISKQIAHQYIPEKLLSRKKSGFSIPFESWFHGALKPILNDLLHEDRLKSDGILNTCEVQKVKQEFFEGNRTYKYKLWSLLIFQLWYNENMK
jgi:asparagine synthase (glutamine-hydrolysing)